MLTLLKGHRDYTGRFSYPAAPQIFDLLQLSRQERECKAEFLRLKRSLHKLNSRYAKEDDAVQKDVMRIEQISLRKQAVQSVILYRLVRRERVRMFRDYIDRLPVQQRFFRTAA